MENISFRNIRESDLKEVSSVFRKTFKNVGEDWSEESSEQHIRENFNQNLCYLAEEDNKIIGIMFTSIQTRVKGPELFIDTIAVLPKYQKRGIGQQLLNKAQQIVKNKRLVGFSLLANPNLKSYSWYKKTGMKESGWVELYRLE